MLQERDRNGEILIAHGSSYYEKREKTLSWCPLYQNH